jgi:hypothetical protein
LKSLKHESPRIEAIVSGRTDGTNTGNYALTNQNDVISISGIHTTVIGADLNHDGKADDNNLVPATWTLGDANALVDGIVIVSSANNFTGTYPTPLLQIYG